MYYIDIAAGSNDGLFATVVHKKTEIQSECYQLVGSFHETTDLVKVELKCKHATINHLIEVIKKFAVNEIKTGGSRELQANKECNKGNDDDLASKILHTESFIIDLKN